MDRRIARAHAMKLIYEWEMGGDGGEETRLNLLGVAPGEEECDYMDRMYRGVVDHADEIDAHISAHARGWAIERMACVDLAILRLGTYELMLGEVAPGIVINEAVELAKTYSTDKAGSFVNGVLGNLSRELARTGGAQPQ